jgi:hypothetical protein
MNWATVATKGATSWIHMDDEGFNTSTQPLTGAKYWVLFYRDPTAPLGYGDMGSIQFPPSYDDFSDHKLAGYMVAEAVELCPGDLL